MVHLPVRVEKRVVDSFISYNPCQPCNTSFDTSHCILFMYPDTTSQPKHFSVHHDSIRSPCLI